MRTRVAGILLAAGDGTRLGQPKATVELDGSTLAERGVRLLRDGGAEPVLVVTGAVPVDIPGTVSVPNPDWQSGMGSSLATGLRTLAAGVPADSVPANDAPVGAAPVGGAVADGAVTGGVLADSTLADSALAGDAVVGGALADGARSGGALADGARAGGAVVDDAPADDALANGARADQESYRAGDIVAAVIALADQPLIGPEAVRRLIAAHDAGATVAVAAYGGKPRNPVLIDRVHWTAVLEMTAGDTGARPFLRAHPDLVTLVECGDVGSPDDIDTPEDLARVRANLSH